MRYDSCQFRSFDGLDNRRTVMELLIRLGGNLPAPIADARRAGFLQGLIAKTDNLYAHLLCKVPPCDAVAAYNYFVAITGVLMVDIDEAARLLEDVVRGYDERDLVRDRRALVCG